MTISFTDGMGAMRPFPRKVYHPVFGERTIDDANDASKLNTDWFDTPALADMARTDTEAQMAIHHNRDVKVADAKQTDAVVRNSVSAHLSKLAGNNEPL